MYTEYTYWSVPQHTFSREHMTAHSMAQDQVVSASFIVIPHAHSHLVSLMSMLNVKFTPFPSLLSSPSASSSRAPMSLPGRTRSWCQSPDAPARWRESGRLVDSAPITFLFPKEKRGLCSAFLFQRSRATLTLARASETAYRREGSTAAGPKKRSSFSRGVRWDKESPQCWSPCCGLQPRW